MKKCLVTGMPNVGKTCFVINFAEYMGVKELKFHVRQRAGYTAINSYSLSEARKKLISAKENTTKEIQLIKLEINKGKTIRELQLIDSCGLSDGIHPDEEVRLAMAGTLRLIRDTEFILHIIDIKNIKNDKKGKDILLPVDRLILDYASMEKKYAILANKMDLSFAEMNLKILKKNIKDIIIIPISALYKEGFKEVKKMVLSYV